MNTNAQRGMMLLRGGRMTKSSNAFASQGLGSGREGKKIGRRVEEGKVPVGTGRRSVT